MVRVSNGNADSSFDFESVNKKLISLIDDFVLKQLYDFVCFDECSGVRLTISKPFSFLFNKVFFFLRLIFFGFFCVLMIGFYRD